MEDYKTEKEFCELEELDIRQQIRNEFLGVELIELLSKFKQHLTERVPADRWINVNDKLPNNRTYVLIRWDCGYDVAEYKHGCFFNELDRINSVTHWQEITTPGKHNTKS